MNQWGVFRFVMQMCVTLTIVSLTFFLFYTMQNDVVAFKTSSFSDNYTEIKMMYIKKPEKQKLGKIMPERRQPSTRNQTRYLIYLCDTRRSCGGWSDRQRGILGAFLLATATGRIFGLNMTYPCDIKLYYIPNEINWYIKNYEIRGLSWEVVDWMGGKRFTANCLYNFNKCFPSDVVFLRTNINIATTIAAKEQNRHLFSDVYRDKKKAFGFGWKKLMKPSFHFEEHIDNFMTKVPDKGDLVCAHIRMRTNPTIPNDGRVVNSLSTVPLLWKFLSKYEKNASRIFIATDSMEVRSMARKRFKSKELDTNGVVLHIDKQGRKVDACLGFEMALLDQAILSKCNVFVASSSGFGTSASMMSDIQQERFMFKNGTITRI